MKKHAGLTFLAPLLLSLPALVQAQGSGPRVRTGADILLAERLDLVAGRRVGLVCNHTSVLACGLHLADALASRGDLRLVALFSPEHGIRGDADREVADDRDPRTGIQIWSLYGATRRPRPEMLEGIDVLLFDIQDVGVRFYTYISTLGHVLGAAADAGVPVVVLDRPNPLGGTVVEGPVILDSLRSFVGFAPITIAHGMTVGELALMYSGQEWLEAQRPLDLTVVRMEGWRRGMWFDSTGLQWVPPSPNMRTLATATVYPGTCLFEGTNISEGRGTERPFELLGSPWLRPREVISALEGEGLAGVALKAVTFVPAARSPAHPRPKYADSLCQGLALQVTDRNAFAPVSAAVAILRAVRRLHPEQFAWRRGAIDRLAGTPALREMIDAGAPLGEITRSWEPSRVRFAALRDKYLLYP